MNGKIKGKYLAATLILLLTGTGFTFGGWRNQLAKANSEMAKGGIVEAVNDYKQALANAPDQPLVHYNLGQALYRAKNFTESEEHFTKAQQLTKDKQLQAEAQYNLGNAAYRDGEAKMQQNPDEAKASLEKALQSYKEAMRANPKDQDAKFNYEFVKKKLDDLKKQQNQDQQHNNQNSEDQKDQQKNDQNKNQDDKQNQKNQQNNDQQNQNQQQNDQQNNQQEKDKEDQQNNQKQDKNSGTDKKENKPDQSQTGEEAKDDKNQSAANAQAGKTGDEQGMTKEQAMQLLDQFKNQGGEILPLQVQPGQQQHSSKDW